MYGTRIIPLTDTQYHNEHGEIYPWFTQPCLEWLNTVDLSDKWIVEYGSGSSTKWFAKRCAWINSVEANREWFNKTKAEIDTYKGHVELSECNEGEPGKRGNNYISSWSNQLPMYVPNKKAGDFYPEIVIVDGILRNECLRYWIGNLSKMNGGLIIADNWQQHSVWISEDAAELMKPYKTTLYVEPSRAHEENPWKTAVFEIPKLLCSK